MARCQACQACRGSGRLEAMWRDQVLGVIPCPACGGSGWEHCCEGLQEQPAAETHEGCRRQIDWEQPKQARTTASAPLPPENNDKR